MKNIVTRGAFIAAGLAILAVAPVYAQTYMTRVDVPFAFFAGEQSLPAGVYLIKYDGAIRSVDLLSMTEAKTDRLRVLPGGASRKLANADKSQLTFHKYGSSHVLKSVFFAGLTDSYDFRAPKIEAELAKAATGPGEVKTITLEAYK